MTDVVSLIDDDASVLEAIGILLGIAGLTAARFESATAFLAVPAAPGCIVCDVRMPDMTGLDLLRKLKQTGDDRPFLLLTGHGDVAMALEAIKLGAFDFLEKPFDNDRLIEAIKSALVAATSSRQERLQLDDIKQRYQSLTERQQDTMLLLIRGHPNKEIGRLLGISPRTVEVHRSWVMTKMHAKTLTDLVRKAMALGIE